MPKREKMKRRIVMLFAIAAMAVASGQAPAPVFETASIKPSSPGQLGMGIDLLPARIRIVNSPLRLCIQFAWNVKDFQVSGGPGWADTEHFDIEARAAGPFKGDEFRAMLQALLAGRFGLVIHRETKERPGYALVPARGGAKLPAAVEDPSIQFSRTPSGDRILRAEGVTMGQLAGALSTALEATVVDRTGIEGSFKVSLQYAPESGQRMMSKGGEPLPPPPPDAVPGPSIFTALQERLGLRLEAVKVPMEVIVIDGASRPLGN
jgi:uncharacterized protein (TIGR03435 family)